MPGEARERRRGERGATTTWVISQGNNLKRDSYLVQTNGLSLASRIQEEVHKLVLQRIIATIEGVEKLG